MTKRWALGALAALSIILITSSAANAQITTGLLVGTVTLQNGDPAPGVTVTATSPALQGERTTVTTGNGDYVLRGLAPGDYSVKFALEGFKTETTRVVVPLGLQARSDVKMTPASIQETIVVTGEAASALETPTVGENFTNKTIDSLATPRDLAGIASLAPGVTTNTPLGGQVTISGGLPYDNLFMVNGVDVNDNVFGNPESLFIEDAINETEVVSNAVSAEYGRFGGGVVNAITKSGGNTFSGTFRTDFTNPSWRANTPLEDKNNIKRLDQTNEIYSATLGGYILKDKLWFFAAGRSAKTNTQTTLLESNIPANFPSDNKRYEGKLTGNISDNHSLQISYINNKTDQIQEPLGNSVTTDTLIHPSYPNDLTVGHYSGVLGPQFFVEAQYSQKNFEFKNSGGSNPDIHASPFSCVSISCLYNGPYFDATDPEERNNKQASASVSYFLNAGSWGSHDLKLGGEDFKNIRTGGNSQSPSGYVFNTDFLTDANGNPILDSTGNAIPVFTPGFNFNTFLIFWDAKRGSRFEAKTDSAYLNDSWKLNQHWSFNLGVRWEKTNNSGTDKVNTINADSFVPRLGATYDPLGNGKYIFQGSYAEYQSAYNLALFTNGTTTGNPGYLYGPYVGPAGQGNNFAPGFDPANYDLLIAGSPTQNTAFAPNVSSPLTKEFSFSVGTQLPKAGYLRLTYQNRKVTDFVEAFTTINNGQKTIVVNGVTAPADITIYDNSNIPKREYQALLLQGRYSLTPQWSLEGNWTHQIENNGNYESQVGQTIGTSGIGFKPEFFEADRNYPDGRLSGYEADVVRLWTIYNLGLGRAGDLSLSLLGTYNSPLTYSLSVGNVPLTAIQDSKDPGYAQLPQTQTLYFGKRGSQEFNAWTTFDFAARYSIPFFRSLGPWAKVDIRNILNDDTLVTYRTTIRPDPNSPKDAFGLPTGFIKATNFGQPVTAASYNTPREYRFSVGLSF
jgi:hypothetical protein